MAWVHRPSGLIKMERSASAFRVEHFFMEADINN